MNLDSPPEGPPYAEIAAALANQHCLTYREEYALRLRLGLGSTGHRYTVAETAFYLGVNKQRVSQILRVAFNKVGLPDFQLPYAKQLPPDKLPTPPVAEMPPEVHAQRSLHLGRFARDLLNRRNDIELTFIQHHQSRVVHVITPRDPERTDSLICLRRGPVTLCGYYTRRGDEIVYEIDDDLLCRPCAHELGPHSARALERTPSR